MKTHSIFFICLVISLFSGIVGFQVYSHVNFSGDWTGIFMNDFKAIVNFRINDQNLYEGNIKMFAGGNTIQDDKIIDINLLENKFTFYIPAKKTSFEGSFNDQMTELSGFFIFPDGSKHAIQLNKSMDISKPIEDNRKIPEQHFDVEGLKFDITFLYSSLKQHHPGLFAFTSKDSIDILVEKLKSEIDTALTLKEFYLLASKLTDAVHCSHTGLKLPITYQNTTSKMGNYFPFRLFFSDNRAFYINSISEERNPIAPGEEIIAINDMPVAQIVKQAFYFIPSEAFNTTAKYNGLNKRFQELFCLLSDSKEFNVKFKTNNSVKSVTISALSIKDVNLDFKTKETEVHFEYLDKMTAGVLKVPTFAIQNMDYYFYQLDSIFKDIRKNHIRNLILDLRDNDGGHPIFAAQLLSYLTNKDFVYFKRNDDVKDFEPLYNTMHPNELNFGGNIYVLVNGGCLSTTGHLISLLKFNTNAIFIGEEPGSTFICNDFSIQLTLPNTGIQVNIPRTTFETAVTGFAINEPFPIDFKVNNTIDSIINGEDAIFEVAKKKINQ
jgi:hypothetical protein